MVFVSSDNMLSITKLPKEWTEAGMMIKVHIIQTEDLGSSPTGDKLMKYEFVLRKGNESVLI